MLLLILELVSTIAWNNGGWPSIANGFFAVFCHLNKANTVLEFSLGIIWRWTFQDYEPGASQCLPPRVAKTLRLLNLANLPVEKPPSFKQCHYVSAAFATLDSPGKKWFKNLPWRKGCLLQSLECQRFTLGLSSLACDCELSWSIVFKVVIWTSTNQLLHKANGREENLYIQSRKKRQHKWNASALGLLQMLQLLEWPCDPLMSCKSNVHSYIQPNIPALKDCPINPSHRTLHLVQLALDQIGRSEHWVWTSGEFVRCHQSQSDKVPTTPAFSDPVLWSPEAKQKIQPGLFTSMLMVTARRVTVKPHIGNF